MTRGRDEHDAIVTQALTLYGEGWFPMALEDAPCLAERDDSVEWVQPRVRGVLPLDAGFRVPRSLARRVRSGRYEVTSDAAFGAVIQGCAEASAKRPTTWLHPQIMELFQLLHEAGHAHSVEAWRTNEAGERGLVGGLYGLALGRVFAGESMFSRPEAGGTDASKVCLVHLAANLRAMGFVLLDAQLTNPHLTQFGLREMTQRRYKSLLARERETDLAWRWAARAWESMLRGE